MKKIYKAPVINNVADCCVEPFMSSSVYDPHQSGTIGADGTEIGSGIGHGNDSGEAKGNGRFWDDEY